MNRIEGTFKHKGVDFRVIKRNDKAIILSGEAPFYDCDSLEVWKVRVVPERTIKGSLVESYERKPSDDDYGMYAFQYLRKRYDSDKEFMKVAVKRFEKLSKDEG